MARKIKFQGSKKEEGKEKSIENIFIEKALFLYKEKKVALISSFLLFFVLCFFIYSSNSKAAKERENVVANVEEAFDAWTKDIKNKDNFMALQKMLNKVPTIKQLYENRIVQQRLLTEGGVATKQGLKLLEEIDGNNKDKSSHYFDFAKIGMIITEKDYKTALKESEDLQKALVSEGRDKTLFLYPYNLLRMSFLAKKIGDREKENDILLSLKKYIDKEENVQFLRKMKKCNQIDIIDYISSRTSELSKT